MGLLSKPLLLICALVQSWIDLFRAVVYLHLNLLCRLAVFPAALFSLPVRALVALFRQRTMEMKVQKMKKALEQALWDRMELKERLNAAVGKRRTVEAMLAELEAEHDEAILHVELLIKEVQELKEEIETLKEVQGQHKSHNANTRNTNRILRKFTANGIKLQQKTYQQPRNNHTISTLAQQRASALFQTLCSAMLSLVVGIVVSGSDGPCTPVVTALTVVVGMSVMSSIHFFSVANQDKSASSRAAIMLLSFNWFLLGTLVYPTVPRAVAALASCMRLL